jgi:hypothetical protein
MIADKIMDRLGRLYVNGNIKTGDYCELMGLLELIVKMEARTGYDYRNEDCKTSESAHSL